MIGRKLRVHRADIMYLPLSEMSSYIKIALSPEQMHLYYIKNGRCPSDTPNPPMNNYHTEYKPFTLCKLISHILRAI